MSAFLYQRLHQGGLLSSGLLQEALLRAVRNKTSLVEELIRADVGYASLVVSVAGQDGEPADDSWRPDSRLLMDLPPGICERLLAFPYRERAGHVEIVTVCPADTSVSAEFEHHLGRGVKLFRGNLQGLLAAAGAPVDLNALSRCLHPSVHAPEDAPLPLVRKSQGRERYRERTPTAPGLGREDLTLSHVTSESQVLPEPQVLAHSRSPHRSLAPAGTARPPTWVSPGAGDEERLRDACNLQELAVALATILPAPSLVFELRADKLTLRRASGPGAYGKVTVSLSEASALSTAAEEGNYLGAWYPCAVHAEFATSFRAGTLVRVERIGSPDVGLVVAMVGDFDAGRAADILDQAETTWARVVEQVFA